MEIDILTTLIGSLGFPIAVAMWLLVVQKKSTDKATESNGKLVTAIENLITFLETKLK